MNEKNNAIIPEYVGCIQLGDIINNTVENYDNLMGYGGALQVGASDNETNVGYVINCNFINNTVITNNDDTHAGALCFRPGIKVINSTFIPDKVPLKYR